MPANHFAARMNCAIAFSGVKSVVPAKNQCHNDRYADNQIKARNAGGRVPALALELESVLVFA